MCSEFRFTDTRAAIEAAFNQIHVPVRWADAPSNRPPEEPIRPTNRATIIRPIDAADPCAGLEGLDVRWWLVPFFHKGLVKDGRATCTNAKFETVDTPTFRTACKARRCLVPLTSFIEYSEPEGWRKGSPRCARRSRGAATFGTSPGCGRRAIRRTCPKAWSHSPSSQPRPVRMSNHRTPAVLTIDKAMEWLDLNGPGKRGFEEPAPAGPYTVAHAPRDAIMSAELRRLI